MNSKFVSCLSVSIAVLTARAAEPELQVLPTVTVIGQPEPSSLTAPSITEARDSIARTPGGASVVDSEKYLTGRTANFEDVFAHSPGVMAAPRGSEDDEVKLSIRGSGLDLGYHVRGIKLLLDGIPVTFADGFGDFQDIDPLSVRYVEVWRGANALRFGATTLGGAINFTTPTGHDASPFHVRFELGSFDYYNGQVSSGGVSGPFDYYGSATVLSRRGFQAHSDTELQRIHATVGYQINEDLETRFYVGAVHSRTQLPGQLTKDEIANSPRAADPDAVAFDQRRDVEWERIANRTTLRLSPTSRLEASLNYSHDHLDHPLFWNPYFLNGLGALDDEYHNFGGEARYTNEGEWLGRKNRFTIGFETAVSLLHDDRYQNLYGHHGAKTADGDFTAVNYNFYAEEQHYFTDHLSAILGGSLTHAQRDYRDHFSGNTNGNQSRDQGYEGFSPKLGVIYEFNEHNQIFANVSRSFEPPTSNEILQVGGPIGDLLTANLKAQTGTTIEVGTRGSTDRINWEAAYYYAWIENELLTVNDANGNPLGTVNEPHTIHQGVELSLDVTLLEGIFCRPTTGGRDVSGKNVAPAASPKMDKITLGQVFNWNDFRFDGSSAYGNNRLAGAPQFWYRAELMYEAPCGFYCGPNVEWASRQYADYANSLSANAYAVLGAKIGFRSQKGWSVFFEARNLTDERYASAVEPLADAQASFGPPRAFHPGEPRSIYGGIEWKW